MLIDSWSLFCYDASQVCASSGEPLGVRQGDTLLVQGSLSDCALLNILIVIEIFVCCIRIAHMWRTHAPNMFVYTLRNLSNFVSSKSMTRRQQMRLSTFDAYASHLATVHAWLTSNNQLEPRRLLPTGCLFGGGCLIIACNPGFRLGSPLSCNSSLGSRGFPPFEIAPSGQPLPG